jgi:hypothetical protein
MPDLFTHLMIGASILLLGNAKKKETWILFLLGNIMVDFERPVSLVIKWLGWDWINITMIFHSFLAILALSLSFACFFDDSVLSYKQRFGLLFLGGNIHLLVDLTMHAWEEVGIFLFYPLKVPFSFNLFWPGNLIYPIVGSIIFLIAFAVRIRLFNQKNENYNIG